LIITVPHLDDETFSLGSYILNRNQGEPLSFKVPSSHVYESSVIPSDVLIIVFCSGGKHNKEARLDTFRKVCQEYKASYIIFDFDDENMYKNPMPVYIDLLYAVFGSIDVLDVCTVSEGDLHQEHFLVSRVTKIACKKFLSKLRSLREFRQPMENFDLTEYPVIVPEHKNKKRLCSLYGTETQPYYEERFRVLWECSK
jgi:LmbE family N-acetylglucosaminyl deacetylase